MQVTVNGETADIPDDQTIEALVAKLGLADRAVAVEVNKQLVPKRQHPSATLKPGDVVEVVTLVGGG